MDEIKKRFNELQQKGVSVKAAFAELLGTAVFVLLGTLVAVHVGHFNADGGVMLNTAVVATTFGLGIAIAIYMIAHTSGGHVNPAVTCSMVAAGITTPVQAIGHVVGQCLGALLAATLLWLITPHHILKGQHLGANAIPEGTHFLQAFLAELVGTFICQLVILECVCHKKNKVGNMAPLVIGTTFALAILAVAPISGAGLNPARSLGPALLSGHLPNLLVYIVAPICGALLAAPVHLFSITEIDTISRMHNESMEGAAGDPLLPTAAGGTN